MRKFSNADLGKGQMLRFKARSADKGSMVSVVREKASRGDRHRERESGQALVEFALILPVFVLLVVGIIQFGVGLNYWLDMQRIANQGARWAVVNKFPGRMAQPVRPRAFGRMILALRAYDGLLQPERSGVPRERANFWRSQSVRGNLVSQHDERCWRCGEDRARHSVHVRADPRARHDQGHRGRNHAPRADPWSLLTRNGRNDVLRRTAVDPRSEQGVMLVLFAVVLPLILFIGSVVVAIGSWHTHGNTCRRRSTPRPSLVGFVGIPVRADHRRQHRGLRTQVRRFPHPG